MLAIVNFFATQFFLLQTQNIEKICHKVAEVTDQESPELVSEAILIEAKYTQLFTYCLDSATLSSIQVLQWKNSS